MITLLLYVLAIENFSDILVNVDLLEFFRAWFESKIPKVGKIVRCKYCQIFWMALAVSYFTVPFWLIYALAMHRLAFIFSEFAERYINQAPWNVFVSKGE